MVLLIGAVVGGFLVGPLKFMIGGWLSYVITDGLVALLIVGWLAGLKDDQSPPTPLTACFAMFGGYCVLEILNPAGPIIRNVMGFRSFILYTLLFFVGFN